MPIPAYLGLCPATLWPGLWGRWGGSSPEEVRSLAGQLQPLPIPLKPQGPWWASFCPPLKSELPRCPGDGPHRVCISARGCHCVLGAVGRLEEWTEEGMGQEG